MNANRVQNLVILVAMLFAVAACAMSAPESQVAAGDAADTWVDELNSELDAADGSVRDELVCRRVRPVGSHVAKEVCMSRAQLEAQRNEALDEVGLLRTMSGDELKRYR